MKILVIDDTVAHQQSARQTLKGHDLTVVGGHDEALEVLSTYTTKPYWDAVLSDLLMPAGRNAQGGPGMQYIGQEMPIGWSLAIQAAILGAKFVAVATDMNHHHHPASAMLDGLDRAVFQLAGARALFTNHVRMVELEDGSGSGKDWGEILIRLLSSVEASDSM